jgi:hypothetical protein
MEVTDNLLTWLQILEIVPDTESWNLNEALIRELETGYGFVRVLVAVREITPESIKINIDSLSGIKVNVSGPQEKLRNWNLLLKALAGLGMQIDEDSKALIIAGDR